MKTLAEKLGVKAGMRVALVNAPEDFEPGATAAGADVSSTLSGAFDRILAFVKNTSQLDENFDRWKSHTHPESIVWICWPKRTDADADLNIKTVIRIGYEHGMVESNAISIDDEWSGLKFTHPKSGKTYNNSYGTLNPAAILHYRK